MWRATIPAAMDSSQTTTPTAAMTMSRATVSIVMPITPAVQVVLSTNPVRRSVRRPLIIACLSGTARRSQEVVVYYQQAEICQQLVRIRRSCCFQACQDVDV